MTDERNWLDKKTWQLSYSMFSGPDIITDTFFTEAEARQAASFLVKPISFVGHLPSPLKISGLPVVVC